MIHRRDPEKYDEVLLIPRSRNIDRSLVQGLKGDAHYLIVKQDGSLEDYAINAVCTHLGCVVPWNRAANKSLRVGSCEILCFSKRPKVVNCSHFGYLPAAPVERFDILNRAVTNTLLAMIVH